MKESIRLELAANCPDTEIEKIKQFMMDTGCMIDFQIYSSGGHKSLKIKYDTNRLRQFKTRGAGRKKKGSRNDETVLRIGEVRSLLHTGGTEAVLSELQISRATYFRRWKSLKDRGYDPDDPEWDRKFFI